MTADPPPRSRNISGLPVAEFAQAMTDRYVTGDTPWDTGVPNAELLRSVDAGDLPGPNLLEVGCGTGTNAIELARRGYRVTAIDLVHLPIEKAREKARRAGVSVDFREGDLTKVDLGGPYDALFDLGVYHGIRHRDLVGFREALKRASRPGTRWLSLAGNSKEPLAEGPPTVSEAEIRSELGTDFRILRLREFRFDLGPKFQPLGWSTLLQRP